MNRSPRRSRLSRWAGRCALLALLAVGAASPAWAGADWPSLSETSRGRVAPSLDVALVIGISDYDQLPDIPGADQNALDWYRWLSGERGVPSARIKVLLDGQVTRETMLDAAAEVAGWAGPGARVWLVFAGHGYTARDGLDGLLIGADARPASASIWARGLPQGELIRALEAGAQRETIAIFDACFSGRTAAGALAPGEQFAVPARRVQTGGAVALMASQKDGVAGPLPGADRPAFSYLVLGAMRGWGDANRDGVVTAQEAVSYARDALIRLDSGRQQYPEMIGPGDTALSDAVETRGPDLEAIAEALRGRQEQPPPPPTPPRAPLDLNLTRIGGLSALAGGGLAAVSWTGAHFARTETWEADAVAAFKATNWTGWTLVGAGLTVAIIGRRRGQRFTATLTPGGAALLGRF